MKTVGLEYRKDQQSKHNINAFNHQDFFISIRFILKTAINLTSANDAHLVLTTKSNKKQIYGFSDKRLEKYELDIANECSQSFKSILIHKNEYLSHASVDINFKSPIPYMAIPLSSRINDVYGCFLLQDKMHSNSFSEEDKILVHTLSDLFVRLLDSSQVSPDGTKLMLNFSTSLSTFTDNLHASKENLENIKLISEIIRVSKLINSTLDLHNLLGTIMESAKLVLRTEGSSLMLIDEKASELYFHIITGEKEEELKEIRVPIGQGIAGIVAETHKPITVNDAQTDARVYKKADEEAGFHTRNLIACPLMVRDKIIGVLEVINTIGRNEFSKEDMELFTTFSEQAAIAIHNRELIDSLKRTNKDLRKKVHELSSLHEVSKALIIGHDQKSLFDSVITIIAEELDAKKSSIMLYEESNNKLEIISSYGFTVSEESVYTDIEGSLSGLAFKENRVIISDELSGPLSRFRNMDYYETGTCIIYPLTHGDQIYGVLNIADKKTADKFSQDEFQLVSIIVGQITKAIENFKLLDEMIDKKAYERELEITSSIQKSILPTKKITSPHFDLGFMSIPAKMMGGDFYDFYQYSENEFAFLIADVSGKSLPAALFMAVTSSIIRTLNKDQGSPAHLLYVANDLVHRDSESGMFVTVFLAQFNAMKSELTFASAGHNEQMIFRKATQSCMFMKAKGAPLGVISSDLHGKFEEGQEILEKGDIVFLYTDGVVEAINEKDEEFGLSRLQGIIKDLQNDVTEKIVSAIYEKVTIFCGKEPQFDDFTLLVIKV